MFGRFLLIILFLGSGLLSAQQKYFVFFKDKGIASPDRFYKTAQLLSIASQNLSKESIERRKQVMGKDSYADYNDLPVFSSYKEQLLNNGIVVDKTLNWLNAVSCYLTSEEQEKVKALSFVDKIEPVRKLKVQNEGNGFDLSFLYSNTPAINLTSFNYGNTYTQNNLSNIPTAHDAGFNGSGVIIGILDTGFELTSRSLSSLTVLAQHDFVFNDDITANQTGDVTSQHDHGTAVFSIMAGMDNGYQIGPAYGAKFLLAKTEDVRTEKNVEEDNYAAALEWMEARGVQITSSSLGYTTFDAGQTSYTYQNMDGKTTIITKAAELAFTRGVVVLTAAGNDGASAWHYIGAPGDGKNVITVGSVTSGNAVSSFSSRGPTSDGRIKPEICAQGSTVYHALPLSTSYSSGSGTSYATPIAAGVTAMLLQAYPHLINTQVRSILIQAGDTFKTPNNDRGYGLLSATRMLNFPNLKLNGSVYEVNKMFIGVSNVVTSSVKLNYSVNSSAQTSISMTYNGTNKYTAQLPVLSAGANVTFTITYNTSTGTVTEPTTDYWEFKYGDLIVYDKTYRTLSTDNSSNEVPVDYTLYQNYPNPFNPSTVISYVLPKASDVTVTVYNSIGQQIALLADNQIQSAGIHKLTWNGRDSNGRQAATGVYFYQLRTNEFTTTKKMLLLK